jgi:replicative DNA helicase
VSESVQVRAVGVVPTVSDLFVGALLYSSAAEVLDVARFVDLDDFDEPGRAVVASVKALAGRGVPPSPQLVADDLKRQGKLTRSSAVWLTSATTSGACAAAARSYAGAVVAESLRRQTESFGQALVSVSATASEAELASLVETASSRIRYVAARLAELRGETP